jgi:hypothetical protein
MSFGDTAVYVGTRLPLLASPQDRQGNPSSDAVEFAILGNRATIADGTLTATAIGRAPFTVRAGGFRLQAAVSVVPRGTIAAGRASGAGSVRFTIDQR